MRPVQIFTSANLGRAAGRDLLPGAPQLAQRLELGLFDKHVVVPEQRIPVIQ
jgi:hypothetical protein